MKVPQFYTSKEVCQRLKISDRTLKRKVAEGLINFSKAPGLTSPLKFTEEDINTFINKHMRI
ncbi:helix-turn-helix domain-containing protein [Bacteroides sedimenti]|uniref:helix-turn-helix domain-containing protein n=1 Tax=Bacteroides sedimenti TaxID=2136147 RepID=UPI00333EFDF5